MLSETVADNAQLNAKRVADQGLSYSTALDEVDAARIHAVEDAQKVKQG